MRHDDQTAIRLAGKRGDHGLDLAAGMDVDEATVTPSDGATASAARINATLAAESEPRARPPGPGWARPP